MRSSTWNTRWGAGYTDTGHMRNNRCERDHRMGHKHKRGHRSHRGHRRSTWGVDGLNNRRDGLDNMRNGLINMCSGL
jgi:hypothetical protein